MAVELDFTGLNTIALREAQRDFKESVVSTREALEEPVKEEAIEVPLDSLKTLLGAVNGATWPHTEATANVDGVALVKLTREQEDHTRLREAYGEYQKNIRLSGSLRTEILKGARAGESTQLLLLKAVECISCMTGDKLFYEQVRKDLKLIYGEVFLEEIPLEWELEEVQERLQKLNEALKMDMDTDARQRVQSAIRSHEERVARLTELLSRSVNTDRARAELRQAI